MAQHSRTAIGDCCTAYLYLCCEIHQQILYCCDFLAGAPGQAGSEAAVAAEPAEAPVGAAPPARPPARGTSYPKRHLQQQQQQQRPGTAPSAAKKHKHSSKAAAAAAPAAAASRSSAAHSLPAGRCSSAAGGPVPASPFKATESQLLGMDALLMLADGSEEPGTAEVSSGRVAEAAAAAAAELPDTGFAGAMSDPGGPSPPAEAAEAPPSPPAAAAAAASGEDGGVAAECGASRQPRPADRSDKGHLEAALSSSRFAG